MTTLRTLPLLLATLLLSALANTASAQDDTMKTPEELRHELVQTPVHAWYFSNALDAAILSTSVFKRPDLDNRKLTTPRFTAIVNVGFDFNYDFDQNFGFFVGLGIKNIGLIEKVGDSTIKRRVYTFGAPLGLKLGNLQKRAYGFIGGGLDIPFNYREKGFVHRGDKTKMNEWFSDRTEHFMPYLFVGASFNPGWSLKLQYYPGNFFNQDFQQTDANNKVTKPFAGYSAQIIYISLGLGIHYKQSERPDNKMASPGS